MSTYFQNPENALKRANEFCEVGKEDEALECLFYALKSRKTRLTQQTLENIIIKFLELCVQHKKSQMIKDGLYNYRYFCQGVNVKSWEDAVRKYIQLSESKVESANETYQSVLLDIDDLDQDLTSTLLRFVSTEGTQERTEKNILIPWIKFLWECYRNCLDLLRNTHLIKLYYTVAKSAFKFCVKFSRRNELRKLCNILKVQTMNMRKRQTFLTADDFETQIMSLETGFVELESALNLELWQETFKIIVDIHAIISTSKKLKHSRIMAHYFDKISSIFWKGEEYLFHAAANLRYLQLVRDQKKNTNYKKNIKLASQTVLSILAVLPSSFNPSFDLVVETDMSFIGKKNRLLSSLLDLPKSPTRISLIKEVIQSGIVEYLSTDVKNLFTLMELELPRNLHSVSTAIKCIENGADTEMKMYIPLIQKVVVAKLLPILSSMFVNINMTKILLLTGISEMSDLEYILVDVARRYEFPLRIDHKNMYIHFSSDFNIFQKNMILDDSLNTESFFDDPLKCLVNTHSALKCVMIRIDPEFEKKEIRSIAEKICRCYDREKDAYRKKILDRKIAIEKHKEFIENLRIQKEEREKNLIAEKLLQYKLAEKERLQKETEERRFQRFQREQEDIKRKVLIEKMETIKKSALGSQIIESIEDFDSLDFQILLSKQIEQLNKERKDLVLKLQRQERTLNHLERAKRLVEIPLLQEQYEEVKKRDVELWKKDQQNKIEAARKKNTQDLYRKNKFLEAKKDLEHYIESVKIKNFESYKREMLQFVKKLEEEKQRRLRKRAEERKEKRKSEWIKQHEVTKQVEKNVKSQNLNIKTNNIEYNSAKQKIIYHVDARAGSSQPRSVSIIDDANFGDTLHCVGKSVSSHTSSKRKYSTIEDSEGIRIPTDIYYHQKVCKSHTVGNERIEINKQRSSFSSRFSRESSLKLKQDTFRSDYRNRKPKKDGMEISEGTTFPWREQSSRHNYSCTNQKITNNNEEISHRTITVLRRENTTLMLEDSKEKSNQMQTEKKISKPYYSQNSSSHSCTPWAKLKRQMLDK